MMPCTYCFGLMRWYSKVGDEAKHLLGIGDESQYWVEILKEYPGNRSS